MVKKNNPDINLQGLAIGNGWVSPKDQFPAVGQFIFDEDLISLD